MLQNAPMAAAELPGLTLEPLEGEGGTAKFDLSLELYEDGSSLGGGIEYSTDLFDGATAARWVNHFEQLLREVAAAPDARLSALELLSAVERHQLLGEWNDTRAAFPETTLLHQLFEARVERSPESIAAVCAGRELTYAGLEARANRLAHLLRDAGLERGAAVGVWLDRSFEMLIAVLGILKAGGHYVALDEAWPAARVESILASTGATAIVAGSGLLSAVEEMRWRLPVLSDVVCLDLAEPEPPAEAFDPGSVRELWDYVAERAVDRATAGGFVSAFTGLALQRGRGGRVPRPRSLPGGPLAPAARPGCWRSATAPVSCSGSWPPGWPTSPASIPRRPDPRAQPRARGPGGVRQCRQRRAADRLRPRDRRPAGHRRAFRSDPAGQHGAVLPWSTLSGAGGAVGAGPAGARWSASSSPTSSTPAAARSCSGRSRSSAGMPGQQPGRSCIWMRISSGTSTRRSPSSTGARASPTSCASATTCS